MAERNPLSIHTLAFCNKLNLHASKINRIIIIPNSICTFHYSLFFQSKDKQESIIYGSKTERESFNDTNLRLSFNYR